ncbi:hypothetical protein [Pseudoclavibacter sp. 13-3]|uniref:hypothetical protein n=1 Tax=Pseudoclavibacter sp. 13-3 TaxID=2901228 RepID=UPI001E33DB0C|nr:hypothetical protein [Pseudoclavibacter sp. 13-3]MCD7102385.1 hypothetical protein [Pseudoclavibacter sp. 13-3]
MKYDSEVAIMKALGIESWRNLSKDKVTRFAAMMPDMDREVRLKIVEQFPVFKDFALKVIDSIQETQEKALAGNKESQAQTHQAWEAIREILKGELAKEDLTSEDRRYIIDLIVKTGEQEFKKDTENKKFLKELSRYTLGAIGSVALLGVVFVGGKIGMEALGGSDDQPNEA